MTRGKLRQERETIIEGFSVSKSFFHSDNSLAQEVLFTSNSKETQHIILKKHNSSPHSQNVMGLGTGNGYVYQLGFWP